MHKELVVKWILIEKELGRYLIYHMSTEKPKYGNNGHEKDTDPDVEWIEWNKPLPDDIDQRQEEGNPYTLEELKELYKDWKPEEVEEVIPNEPIEEPKEDE